MITIEQCENGFIVTEHEDFSDKNMNRHVYSFWDDEKLTVVDMLNHIKNTLGYNGSKHDEKRIFIELRDQ